ncbi:cysteate racemase [Dickeya solani]|uniref:Amino acid racemase n=1 Tax=Dickeya solani TaxID=1089444 RepID=A0ABU4EFZ6_9GAMM|nr:amino acid racemase [Dickeya solani]MCA6998249.1 amino acid racemase [Dickeya solani]MCZ0823364.1 amino acid racemase [Dickeya solani]MDV6994146.1 amino acid racemase [Dickeya solani]MDV7004256.1 amino acid racemase [Dickeya solani]MDV7038329.1 amino acid racemase [Dickeya solani]
MNPVVGILGGMGPGATVDAMQKLIRQTPARKDQEHIPMIAVSIPDIPDRTQCILNHSASPLKKMVEYLKILEKAGATCIIIPCNTAHYWFEDLKRHTELEMISIIDATCQQVAEQRVRHVAILATTATVHGEIYQHALAGQQVRCTLPTDEQQDAVMSSIYAYKAGDVAQARTLLLPVVASLRQRGVEKIILGCTELPLILEPEAVAEPDAYLDATDALIKKTIAWYYQQITHPPVAA